MSKMFSRVFKFQLFLCFALAFSSTLFGQSIILKNDLNKSFKNYSIVHLDGEALRQVENGRSLTIATDEKTFVLNLTPNDLRSARYRAEETTADGLRQIKTNEKVITYKGTIDGENNSQVRLTIDGETVSGFFTSAGNMYFVESANLHSESADKGDLIVYKEGDFLNNEGYACFSELQKSIESGKDYVFSNGTSDLTNLRIIELATEADFEFVSQAGGAAAANNKILTILNMVEGAYENDLGLTISVVYQHNWTTDDPFDTNNPGTTDSNCQSTIGKVLCNFKNYWNTNISSTQVPRDTAHLWTGKQNLVNQGFAFIRVMCSPTSAYGLSGSSEWEQARFLISAHEIAHNLGATHADSAQSCDNTIMNMTLSTATPLTFCAYSRSEIANYVASSGGCLATQTTASTLFDFDGDRKSDISVFRPGNGVWYINASTNNFIAFQFGQNGDKPVSADFDGDGKADAAVFRGGTWYILRSSTGSFYGVQFGLSDDVPIPADYDGDGKADIAVFRPSNGVWYFLFSGSGSYSSVQFGQNGDVPVTGNYDGDNKADINLFRPSTGVWYRLNSGNGSFFAAQFGSREDKSISGDFDGDGKNDLAVWRPSSGIWYVVKSSDGSSQAIQFGAATDIPTAGDFDGDGKTDMAVYRPSTGVWYRLNSGNGSFFAAQFGISSDIPVQSYYIR